MPFLLPPKRECRKADVGLLLYNAMRQSHGPTLSATIIPDCQTLQILRCCLHDTSTTSLSTILMLKKYSCAIEYCNENITSSNVLPQPLVWADSFSPNQSIISRNILLDASGALYNAGVYESILGNIAYNSVQEGEEEEEESERNYLTAAQHMQRAAGCFQAAKNICKEGSDSYDALALAMLGNAQQAFVKGVAMRKASPNVVAKFAAGAKAFYEEAENKCGNWSSTGIAVGSSCGMLKIFAGCMARVKQADACREQGDVGVRLSVLRKGVSEVDDGVKEVNRIMGQCNKDVKEWVDIVGKEVLEELESLGNRIKRELNGLEDQNRRHFFVEEVSSAPRLVMHQSVKAAMLDEEMKGLKEEIKKLMPKIELVK